MIGQGTSYVYNSYSRTVALLLHVQHYQRCKPTISKIWVKNKFVLWQPRYYNLLTEKGKKIYVFEALLFLKTCCYCQSQETFFKYHLKMIYFWKILHGPIQLF